VDEARYADAGVDIDAGNRMVDLIKPLVRATARAGAGAEIGGFGGLFDLKAAGFNWLAFGIEAGAERVRANVDKAFAQDEVFRVIERVRRARRVDQIVGATTDNPADDPIEELARRLDVGCFRGSEDDVLDRVLRAAQSMAADVIVEITGDLSEDVRGIRIAGLVRPARGVVVGLVVAVGGDSPEFTSAQLAVQRGAQNVGFGVLIGSNIYNIAFLLGLSGLIAGPVSTGSNRLTADGAFNSPM